MRLYKVTSIEVEAFSQTLDAHFSHRYAGYRYGPNEPYRIQSLELRKSPDVYHRDIEKVFGYPYSKSFDTRG